MEQRPGARRRVHPLPSHAVPFLASSPTPALCLLEGTAHCTTTMGGEGASYSRCISFTHPTTSNPSASLVDVAFICVLFSLSTAPILVPAIIISHLYCRHHLLTGFPVSTLHSTILTASRMTFSKVKLITPFLTLYIQSKLLDVASKPYTAWPCPSPISPCYSPCLTSTGLLSVPSIHNTFFQFPASLASHPP